MLRLRGGSAPRRPGPVLVALIALLALGALATSVTGCGTSGRSMQSPEPGATAPPRRAEASTTTVAGVNNLAPSTLFDLSSIAFPPGAELPVTYTCDGDGSAPPLSWENVPAGTVELALTITDPDAANFIHWVVAGLPADTTGIGPEGLPAGSVELTTTAGTTAYVPPCPPAGESHTYDFTLYALGAPSGLTAASDTQQALIQLASDAIGTAVLTATYTRASAN